MVLMILSFVLNPMKLQSLLLVAKVTMTILLLPLRYQQEQTRALNLMTVLPKPIITRTNLQKRRVRLPSAKPKRRAKSSVTAWRVRSAPRRKPKRPISSYRSTEGSLDPSFYRKNFLDVIRLNFLKDG